MSTFFLGKRSFEILSHSYSTFAGFGGRYLAIFGIREVEKRVKSGRNGMDIKLGFGLSS